MTTTLIGGREVHVDEEGFMTDPAEWTEELAPVLAKQVGIDELTPDHKAVILLRELEGLSYEEISRVMQCSKGTVMSRLHYARKKLQARLKEFV